MVQSGQLQVGQLTAFILYLNAFFQPIQQLVQQYNLFQQGQAAIVKLDDLLATHPTVEEAPDARPLPPIEGDIDLVGVSFGYDPAIPVLVDVNLQIRAGETVSFVGPTAPASRPSPSSSRGSTTRPRAASASTVTTCAT